VADAEQGFEVTGVDFSPVALAKARAAADARGVAVRFLLADLTATAIPGLDGPFDLLADYGTLDDLRGRRRAVMAATVLRLSAPGSRFLLWCFYGGRGELPWIPFAPSRLAALAPGEERRLFGDAFEIERLPSPPGTGAACFLMPRRA
jgi:SAM-dependent methyltransferase